MSTEDSCTENWKALQQREWLVIGLFLGFIPVVFIIDRLFSVVTTSEIPIIITILWMLVLVWAVNWVSSFPCPRCSKRFYLSKYLYWTLGRKCPHCGLHRYN